MQRRSLLAAASAAGILPLLGRPARAQAGAVVGAGSVLPRAVYQKWIEMAGPAANLKVTYEQNGGSAALDQLKNRAIDFASVDYPRRPGLLRENQLIQFPTVLTPVLPFVNLPGVAEGQLRLTGELLADIFLGKITKWNDAEDQGTEQRREPARHQHRAGPPPGGVGRQPALHHLSEPRLRGLGRRTACRDDGEVAAGQGRRGGWARRAGGQGEGHAGRDRLWRRHDGEDQRLHLGVPEEPPRRFREGRPRLLRQGGRGRRLEQRRASTWIWWTKRPPGRGRSWAPTSSWSPRTRPRRRSRRPATPSSSSIGASSTATPRRTNSATTGIPNGAIDAVENGVAPRQGPQRPPDLGDLSDAPPPPAATRAPGQRPGAAGRDGERSRRARTDDRPGHPRPTVIQVSPNCKESASPRV